MLALGWIQCSPLSSVKDKNASEILGNPDYQAISYGGYRGKTREEVPSVEDLKEDMKILHAMGIRIVRTYNTQQFDQAANLLEAIQKLKEEDSEFEMYVMLGAWIDCEGAWTDNVNHDAESVENNTLEIEAAVKMAKEYPDIVKVIAVGNEAMVHWAGTYFVYPDVILKWVNYLQELKSKGELPENIWITSSDNFASWGGSEDKSYHIEDLTKLIEAVDFISMHTYPFHDTNYNPDFWKSPIEEEFLTEMERIDLAMKRAGEYAKSQYQSVKSYMESLGLSKPIHIGETGWASVSKGLYGENGSKAADEYKMKLYYDYIREWTNSEGISSFYFEAYDEQWKDAGHPDGSENHFGLIDLKGQAKYPIWNMVDEGVFEGLTRNGKSITKTFDGEEIKLMKTVQSPPLMSDLDDLILYETNDSRNSGQLIDEMNYIVFNPGMNSEENKEYTYPSEKLKLNAWEGTCHIKRVNEELEVSPGSQDWWGCAIELPVELDGENLSNFNSGKLHFEIKIDGEKPFEVGFQTGYYGNGSQTNNFVVFGSEAEKYPLINEWKSYSVSLNDLDNHADLTNVKSLFYLRGHEAWEGGKIRIKNIYYSR